MKLVEFISPDSIFTEVDVDSKKNLFKKVSSIFSKKNLKESAIITDRLNERERLGSTGIGEGVAIPHTKVDSIEKTKVIFLKLKSGIDFSASDKKDVDIVFVILAPEECQSEHLLVLSSISSFLRDKSIIAKLRSLKKSSDIHDFFSKF
ncbi:MAG: PTS sugar transporter subunit IIA [Pseudomonadota bacterium]|nr:PTS sugar transporter subunit IIA [Pseudomonadota bacterium]